MKTAAGWQKFLENSLSEPDWVETCEDSACNTKFHDQIEAQVQGILQRCQTVIEENPKIRRCSERLRSFVPTWLRQHDDTSYGFNVDNKQYLADEESALKPEGMMKIPDEILSVLPDQQKVQEVARRNGWKYLTHDSALAGVRTFVVIQDPQDRFDQWMLLNLKNSTDHDIALNMPVSIVGVQKRTRDGETLPRVRLHFRDYSMTESSGKVKLTVNLSGNGKCYSCHSNGMRQLIPRRTATLEALPVKGEFGFGQAPPVDFAYWRLTEFNKIIRQYGTNDWNGMMNPADQLGPMLGAEQKCTACHNAVSRAPVTVFTSPTQLRKKLVDELSMPPKWQEVRWLEQSEVHNPPLSEHEMAELAAAKLAHESSYQKFMASRFPSLRDWILERSCL